VPDTISKLALAGIKLWVLTGDKVETAINIACSCNLIESNSDVIRVTGCKSAEEVSERLDHAYEQFIVPLDRGGLQAPRDGDDEVLVVNQSNGVSGGGDEKKDDAGDRELDNISPRSSSRRRRTRGDSRGAQLAHLVKDSILHVAGTGAPVEPIDAEQLAEEARGSLTLVVDGQSLEFITNDAVLSNNFLTIGRRCRSVVCCRVSPLQKSLVVKLVRLGLGARCLAVGDGANDVSMIQAAQVGVGISGNEGMQAVMASDFAIAQFRFLQDLLLVHGRNNYRRLCKLVLYSFYKNMAFVLVQFWYGADSAWSAENLYDAYAMALFNLAFTTLPLMCMGLFDRDVSRKSILQLPQLYESGRLSHDFGAIHLLLRLVAGIAASLILWYTMRAVGDEGVMRGDGKNTDQWVLGTMVYNVVILTATGAVMLDFRLWNVTHVCAIVISLAVWIIFLLAYGELRVPPENMYKLPLVMFEIPAFWLTSVLMPIGVLLPEFTLWYVQWQFFPRNDQIVAEVEQQGRELSDEELKRIARQYGDSAPVQVNAANYVRRGFERVFNRPDRTQSQYATATTLGDVDVLRRLNMFNPLVDPPKRRRRTLGSLLKKSKTKKEKQKQAKRQNSLTASTSTMTSSAGSTISSSDNK
jgi:magnesium-transporting ATPase (P-type)